MDFLSMTLDEGSRHLVDKDIKQQLKYIENICVLAFILLVHIPLSNVSIGWTFLTGFIPWFVDTETKLLVYSWA